jgi:hypothetical protein
MKIMVFWDVALYSQIGTNVSEEPTASILEAGIDVSPLIVLKFYTTVGIKKCYFIAVKC